MANEIFTCTGTPYAEAAGIQTLGRAVVNVPGVKSGGTHYDTLSPSISFTVDIATYTDNWTDRFDDPRYYVGDAVT